MRAGSSGGPWGLWWAVAILTSLVSLGGVNAHAAPFAYITNGGGNTVTVIDTATNVVVATVTVGPAPVGVAVNAAGTLVYVANSGPNTVSVIDTATNAVVDTVSVGTGPIGVAVTPDGTRVYVVNRGSNNVSVIDTRRSPWSPP